MNIFTPKVMSVISSTIRSRVVSRTTRQYKDYLGQKFSPYSAAYVTRKKLLTSNANLNKDKVSLWLSGQMLKDFYVTTTAFNYKSKLGGKSVDLQGVNIKYGFKTRESLAKYNWNARGRRNRDFLGMKSDESLMPESEIKTIVFDAVRKGF